MNEQQREALEKVEHLFPRGLLCFTIAPNNSLQAMLNHPAVPSSGKVDLDPEKEPDAVALNGLVRLCIRQWDEWDEEAEST